MGFSNRQEYVDSASSEKLILAQVEATTRLFTWTLDTGSRYLRVTDNFVVGLKEDQTDLTEVSTLGAVVAGTWFYDATTSTLYVETTGSADPATVEMIVTYRFFYGNREVTASSDLTDTGSHVRYQGRISSSPGYKHKIGIEQRLTSLVGSGTLVLENGDGGLDDIFDTLFFENHECFVYSWNSDLSFSEAKLIYRGRVTNKVYTGDQVKFTIKDQIFDLEQNVPQSSYTDSDNVNDNIKGRFKRWVYGRVDGLQLQSIDQIGDGYALTGTVAAGTVDGTLTGSGTSFLSETSPDDTITIGTQEFTIESVESDTSLTLDNTPQFSFTGATATLVPDIPTITKNRDFFVAGHACAEITKTITQVVQFNRVVLNDTSGLFAGDFVEFATGERLEIKNVAPGNIIVLRQNLIVLPAISSNVIRRPVQEVFIEGTRVIPENFTITNTGAPTNELTVTLDSDTEFQIARTVSLGVSMTFTNGSRDVTTAAAVDLRDILKPRDWIRPTDLSYTTFYEILSVDEQALELRVVFGDPNHTGATQGKLPSYVGDDTIISSNVLGKTVDGEPDGEWITTASRTVRDLIGEIGITNLNTTSFDDAETDAAQVVSLALPLSPSGSGVATKTAVDLINKSVFAALTLDNNLDLQYRVLQHDVPDSPRIIMDEDVIKWSIKSTNGKTFRNNIIRYKHQDIDRGSLEAGTAVVDYTSEFVRDYIGTNKTDEFDVYLYNTAEATIMAHRYVYFNRLGRSDIVIDSDLRLEDIEIGDVVQLEFDRLYKRFGDTETRKKLMVVIGRTVSGDSLRLEATDLGNTYNSSGVITPNTTNDYTSATVDEKLKYGFITTTQGIVDSDEDTSNINLIS